MYAILSKEFTHTLHSSKSYLAVLLTLVILALITIAIWPTPNQQSVIRAEVSIHFSMLMTTSLLFLTAMMVPIICAPAVTLEKEKNTWEVLLTTPLPLWQILMGKVGVHLGYLVWLLLITLPISYLCTLMGGIDAIKIFDTYGIILCALAIFALISLWCSAYFQRTYAALAASYCAILPLLSLLIWLWYRNFNPDPLLPEHGGMMSIVFLALLYLVYLRLRKAADLERDSSESGRSLNRFFILYHDQENEQEDAVFLDTPKVFEAIGNGFDENAEKTESLPPQNIVQETAPENKKQEYQFVYEADTDWIPLAASFLDGTWQPKETATTASQIPPHPSATPSSISSISSQNLPPQSSPVSLIGGEVEEQDAESSYNFLDNSMRSFHYEPTVFLRQLDAYLKPQLKPGTFLSNSINPIYAKELYYELSSSENLFFRLLLLWCSVVVLFMSFFMASGLLTIYLLFAFITLFLVIPALSGSSFPHEAEISMAEILQTTPIPFYKIYLGKAMSLLRTIGMFLSLLLIPCVAVLSGNLETDLVIQHVLLLISTSVFLLFFSLWWTSKETSTMKALVSLYVVLFLGLFVPALMILALSSLPSQTNSTLIQWISHIAILSPFIHALPFPIEIRWCLPSLWVTVMAQWIAICLLLLLARLRKN